jgi:DNA sulfur modification protein DndC
MTVALGMPARRATPFKDRGGLATVVKELTAEIQDLYLADEVPWVVGYSGGKDSTAVLQLVWLALQELPEDRRNKHRHTG